MNAYGLVREQLSYMEAYAPTFPAEDETDLSTQFERLFTRLDEALALTKNADKRRWIEMAIREAREAQTHFAAGREEAGSEALRGARQRFENVTQGKSHVVDFVVGSTGEVMPTGARDGGVDLVAEQRVRSIETELLNRAIESGVRSLEERGGVVPFLIVVDQHGKSVVHVADERAGDYAVLSKMVEEQAREAALVEDPMALCYVRDVKVVRGAAEQRSLQITIDHRDGQAVTCYLTYSIVDDRVRRGDLYATPAEYRFLAT